MAAFNNKALARCIGCDADAVRPILDFGAQPPSNRFFRAGEPQKQSHGLVLGQCVACALVQLIDPMPAEMVRSRYEWISYNEPEGHLDQMVEDLIATTGLQAGARIVGLSYKDDTTLARFNRRGYTNTYRYSIDNDLDVAEPLAGLETIQSAMTPERAEQLVRQHGQADLLLVRHVLEHAHAPKDFLKALASLVKPSGCMVFEMPESSKFLAAFDYSFIWEEHIAYFTTQTVSRLIQQAQLDLWVLSSYVYPLEDSLVALVRPVPAVAPVAVPSGQEMELGLGYGRHFDEIRERIRGDLLLVKTEGKKIAVFGAGHLAAKFLNLFELSDLVSCVIDDNPNKSGLLMPGSGVPVRPSSALMDEKIDLCLLSLSPESEKKVVAAKKDYLDQGGRFLSIFALSPIAYQSGAR
jgi:SAM-dependent methyltransferase